MEEQPTVERNNSCEISISTKGLFSSKIKVYSDSIDDAVKRATDKAKDMEIVIKEKNGLIGGNKK